MQEEFAKIGFLLIIAGILIIAFSAIKDNTTKTEAAVIGFIGPIPIGFGTGKDAVYLALTVGAIMLVAFYLLFR